MDIPIIIVCYNNYKYVENMLNQIRIINPLYYKNIHIVNNCSNCEKTIHFLQTTDVDVIQNHENSGPWITDTQNRHIYNMLPDKYILTDPDLEFCENMPSNFIEILSELSDKYYCYKIGLALKIDDFVDMYDSADYTHGKNIYNWEEKFWRIKEPNEQYELYRAVIDTTFCLINKNKNKNEDDNIRIAGNFIAKHLPWYKKNKIYNIYENYMVNTNTTHISTISKITIPYIESNYLKVTKNKETFFIENKPDMYFWRYIFSDWELELHCIFDKYLSSDKVFIDIGESFGVSAMYGSRKSSFVYSLELPEKLIDEPGTNMKDNCKNNYKLIFTNYNSSFSLKNFMISENINDAEISLVKINMLGGEENILENLYATHKQYNITICLVFHYYKWLDKNLDRFSFLTDVDKQKIQEQPMAKIIFEKNNQVTKNTVLLIEPRIFDNIPAILEEYYKHLGNIWNYVFYCGKDKKNYWAPLLGEYVELRELEVDNFPEPRLYNDFMKKKGLWESLSGEFVLTIQTDTWIVSSPPYTIDYFLKLNKSYIGGNCNYIWNELRRENLEFEYRNFNGGLSLRKRNDMIRVIDNFPPLPTVREDIVSNSLETDAEDCYFTIGCNRLGLSIGNDEPSSHFAVHDLYKDSFFGIHKPMTDVAARLTRYHSYLCGKNSHLNLKNPKLTVFYRYSDSQNNKSRPSYFSKETCLMAFLKRFSEHIVYVVADNVCEETYSFLCKLLGISNVIRITLDNSKSFLCSVQLAIDNLSEYERIYLVEDDYIHTKDSAKIIMEGLDISDYVSGYDHADKYINYSDGGPNPYIKDGGEETRVMLSKSRHWKITNSCCMTFATTVKILKDDKHIYEEFCKNNIPDDFAMFTKLKHNGRKIISCIPGVSTRCETSWLSPLVDWEKEVTDL